MSVRQVFPMIFGIAVLCMLAGGASAETNDLMARELARNAVRSQLHLKPDQFLSVQRDERLEQSLALAAGKRSGSELIYKVSQNGDEVKENAVVHHTSTDADLDYIIAIGAEDGDSYRINGFADSVAEFEKLITALGVKVSSAEQAESLTEFYLAVNPENLSLTPISSLIELKQAAERQCQSGVKSFDTGQKEFTNWWNRARPLYEAVSFQQRIVSHDRTYLVEWFVLSTPSGANCGGTPVRAKLEVGSNGHVGKVSFAPIHKT
jgi:hypothetical protein